MQEFADNLRKTGYGVKNIAGGINSFGEALTNTGDGILKIFGAFNDTNDCGAGGNFTYKDSNDYLTGGDEGNSFFYNYSTPDSQSSQFNQNITKVGVSALGLILNYLQNSKESKSKNIIKKRERGAHLRTQRNERSC